MFFMAMSDPAWSELMGMVEKWFADTRYDYEVGWRNIFVCYHPLCLSSANSHTIVRSISFLFCTFFLYPYLTILCLHIICALNLFKVTLLAWGVLDGKWGILCAEYTQLHSFLYRTRSSSAHAQTEVSESAKCINFHLTVSDILQSSKYCQYLCFHCSCFFCCCC